MPRVHRSHKTLKLSNPGSEMQETRSGRVAVDFILAINDARYDSTYILNIRTNRRSIAKALQAPINHHTSNNSI